ncbi:uncharacterized protein JN00_0423 [Metamycoplasma subdolum]|uniref:S1 motif domain-containing protein n=1 Tax=Metamycoplasma subdolum TaxID=92407 RepID=A0A3M0AEG5_9BACT|nr:Tex-like N-terminal domain-containing protein [Metamycoplasma subdolum]RMA77572.1 uncharacterized protein JN00_0423 [Metamycoplasma subdolum]WPB50366.1 Tex-like N-terminal domain-containing protein [Metamycoplasma subdolum]
MNDSILNVAKILKVKVNQVEVVLKLLEEKATIPFIARYRKAQTEGLNEEQILKINELYEYDVELNKRKEYVLQILEEKKLLTDELKNKIINAQTKAEVENIYEPFKIGKKTKASEAIAMGLEPLALEIMRNEDQKFNPYAEARKYLSDKLTDADQVIEQASFIIAQIISQDIKVRDYVKDQILNWGYIETKKKKNAEDEKEVFERYYDHKEKASKIPNHRVLAIARGEDLKIISYDFTFNDKKIIYDVNQMYFKNIRTGKIILECVKDALERLIIPSIIREIKSELFARAEKDAIKIFADNVEQMLLAPATKNKRILAIDPAYINGCKIAILDENGNFLSKSIIFPHPPRNKVNEAKDTINSLVDKYNIDLIAIGNGTASRETEALVSDIIKERKLKNKNEKLVYAIVSEIGASVYSVSKVAQEEFPNLNVEERSAINIGRRFQDPLNELIKIDPKSIGVGQYQHDVNQKELEKQLDFKVNKAVNLVGVDLNSATKTILSYISGLSEKIAQNIIDYRKKNGNFKNREELKEVKGLGEKAYEQAIGFLRIHDSDNFYDKTNIHPESYKIADKIVKHLKLNLVNDNKEILGKIDSKDLAKELAISEYDVALILDSLSNPGKDIRDDKEGFIVSDEILSINDLTIGKILNGQVLNITDFGAFVFIGVKQNCLVHISKMQREGFEPITHPSQLLKVGENIKVKIIEVDPERGRIQGELIWN